MFEFAVDQAAVPGNASFDELMKSFELAKMPGHAELFNFSPLFTEFMYLCLHCVPTEKNEIQTLLNHDFIKDDDNSSCEEIVEGEGTLMSEKLNFLRLTLLDQEMFSVQEKKLRKLDFSLIYRNN